MHYGVTSAEAKKISRNGSILRKRAIGIKYLIDEDLRFSVVISKKQGKSVERNRGKADYQGNCSEH